MNKAPNVKIFFAGNVEDLTEALARLSEKEREINILSKRIIVDASKLIKARKSVDSILPPKK